MTDDLLPASAPPPAPRRRPAQPRWARALGWGALVLVTLVLALHRQWGRLLPTAASAWPTVALAWPTPAPVWQQVMPMGAEVEALAQDEQGNLYLAGTFEDTLRLGSSTLVSAGETDVFVACWQPEAGRFRWAKRAGGPGYDVANALAVRGGAVYVAGYVGAIEPRQATTAYFDALALPSGGVTDMFVAKLTAREATAAFAWVQGMRGARYSEVQELAVRGDAVYLAGTCQADSAALGAVPLIANPFQGPKADTTRVTLFVARLTDYGRRSQYAWAQPLRTPGADSYLTGLAVADSALYVAGNFAVPPYVDYGAPTDIHAAPPTPPTQPNILRYTDRGDHATLVWERRVDNPATAASQAGGATVNALAVRGHRLVVAGAFRGEVRLGAAVLTTPDQAGYLACLTDNPAGPEFAWAALLTGPAGRASRYRATTLALHDSAVYVAGRYETLLDDGTDYFRHHPTLTEQFKRLADYQNFGIFVSEVIDTGPQGAVRWQQTTAGNGTAHASALAAAPAGPVYVAGSFTPGAQFGRFWLSFGTPHQRMSAGFWAELGDDRSKERQVVEVKY